MTDRPVQRPAVDGAGLVIGVAVGRPGTVAAGALMLSRLLFGTTNAALLLMLEVAIVAAVGGRIAGYCAHCGRVVRLSTPDRPVADDRLARRRGDDGARARRRHRRRDRHHPAGNVRPCRPRRRSGVSTAWRKRLPRDVNWLASSRVLRWRVPRGLIKERGVTSIVVSRSGWLIFRGWTGPSAPLQVGGSWRRGPGS
jgi:hypothetical protein